MSPWNNVAIRPGSLIDGRKVNPSALVVRGSVSGIHPGRLVLSDDAKTLVFLPERPFSLGETVTVALGHGVWSRTGDPLPALSYQFTVSPTDPRRRDLLDLLSERERNDSFRNMPSSRSPPAYAPFMRQTSPTSGDLPPGYPNISLMAFDDPEPGYIFISPFTFPNLNQTGHLIILDNYAQPIFYRRSPPGGASDFKMQPNGLLTYIADPATYYGLDSSYTVVDTWCAGNGYTTDGHDLQLLPNGHALLLCYEPEYAAMDTIVPGGDPDAVVIGLVVQELDAEKNVVFQWRSWDHVEITDSAIELNGPIVDYIHGNAVELDHDGNLLISLRHFNEITKVDRATGDIIWRMGMHAVKNEFTFVNDSRGFSFQHDIRRLPNGDITLFDNGNTLNPQYSRGLEYRLDEENKIATLVWEYRNTPDTYGYSQGNVQRRASGGTMIGWGSTAPETPRLTDVHPDGSKALELGFDPNTWSYRAFRFPWSTNRFVTEPKVLDFGPVPVGNTRLLPLTVSNHTPSELAITCFLTSDLSFAVEDSTPLSVPAGGSASVGVRFTPSAALEFDERLYVRSVDDTQLVAQVVELRGTAVSLSIGDAWIREGDAGAKALEFTVTPSAPSTRAVMVDYFSMDETAKAVDNDYQPVTGTATIPPEGQSTKISVSVNGDVMPEDDETLLVFLSNPRNAVIGTPSVGTGTIVNDDGVTAVADPPVTEFSLGRILSNPSRGLTQIEYALPIPSPIRLSVLDLLGREVAVVAEGIQPAGRHLGSWNGRIGERAAPPGMYFVRYQTPKKTFSGRILLIR